MPIPLDVTKPDKRIQPIIAELEKIELELIENRTFADQDIYLDGREFISCIFKNCTMHVKLGHFSIRGTNTVLVNCDFKYYPPAESIKSISGILAYQQNI